MLKYNLFYNSIEETKMFEEINTEEKRLTESAKQEQHLMIITDFDAG